MNRKALFVSYKTHPLLWKSYMKLNSVDLMYCEEFINKYDSLGKGEFERKINGLFIDGTSAFKNWKYISELLCCANSGAKEEKKSDE